MKTSPRTCDDTFQVELESGTVLDMKLLEATDVFLVPLGPDKEGMRYEAVFT